MAYYNHEALIEVSLWSLALASTPLGILACISWYFSIGIERPILIGVVRTFVQLSILGVILDPIFVWGVDLWGLVLAYILFMITLAAYESATRSKYYFHNMFWYVMFVILLNIAITSIFSFGLILQLDPLWDPQYVIPIVGMLLGNCINGVSLSLDNMLTSMAESSREIELMLSFGATSYEASSRLLKEAIRTGSMPQINSMAIIGLISIPGMMTGQMLAGSTVVEAARYQILIMYFIAMCSFGSIFSLAVFMVRICFDSRIMLRADRLEKRVERKSLLSLLFSCVTGLAGSSPVGGDPESSASVNTEESSVISPRGELSVTTSTSHERERPNSQYILTVNDLSFAFQKKDGIHRKSSAKSSINQRVLFQRVSFQLRNTERALVDGPSGAGKSTLLRIVAGLTPSGGGEIMLCGKAQSSFEDMTVWRKQVLYVPQTKVDIPGSPRSLLERISSFRVWKTKEVYSSPLSQMTREVQELVQKWEMMPDLLDAEWKMLSGGESQRLLLAIVLASRPKVVLLDESTSALDLGAKIIVERSIESYCDMHGTCVIWITHDQVQQGRIHMH